MPHRFEVYVGSDIILSKNMMPILKAGFWKKNLFQYDDDIENEVRMCMY